MTGNKLNWLCSHAFAHRGLHDHAAGIPENSMPAFQQAIKEGYGITLDVQVISDEQVIVFHDRNLVRMCGREVAVRSIRSKELALYTLLGTRERIPRLDEVLHLVAGKVPLIVKVRRQTGIKYANRLIANTLLGYRGQVALMSFDPLVLNWFLKNVPLIQRGQLSSDFKGIRISFLVKFLLRNLMLNFVSKPHFVVFDEGGLPSATLARKRKGNMPVLAWNISSEVSYRRVESFCDNIVFEGFHPSDRARQ